MIRLTKRQREEIQTRIDNGKLLEAGALPEWPQPTRYFDQVDGTPLSPGTERYWWVRGACEALQYLLDSTGVEE